MEYRRVHINDRLIPFALCLGLICIVAACGSDRRESFYSSLGDADKDGAITRGWIPDFLPGNSSAIHELHYTSPSTEWCAFEFQTNDSEGFRRKLNSIDALPQHVRRVPNPGVTWWPAVLRGDLDVEKIHHAGLELYKVEMPLTSVSTGIWLFAIDWSKGRSFFYATSE
jgi:hypothetical protein